MFVHVFSFHFLSVCVLLVVEFFFYFFFFSFFLGTNSPLRDLQNLYRDLVQSFAPSIYGHEEVKKGILLMLFGGVHKVSVLSPPPLSSSADDKDKRKQKITHAPTAHQGCGLFAW